MKIGLMEFNETLQMFIIWELRIVVLRQEVGTVLRVCVGELRHEWEMLFPALSALRSPKFPEQQCRESLHSEVSHKGVLSRKAALCGVPSRRLSLPWDLHC